MKVGITGSQGFIAWHLKCYLKTLESVHEVREANRETFLDTKLVDDFVEKLDLIVHLAGVNRASEKELLVGNIEPAQKLADSLNRKKSSACVIYASSTYAESAENSYGKGKSEAGNILSNWAENSDGRRIELIIPHVFGEHGRPFYNSAVATFCHQITRGNDFEVNKNGQLELIHVQTLVGNFIQLYLDGFEGTQRITGKKVSVEHVVNKIQCFHNEYKNLQRWPDINNDFDRDLFNTLRASTEYDERKVFATKHNDERGWLVETMKAGSGGQCFVSTTLPGITRGNHFHRRKAERFFVLQGQACIKLRRVCTREVISYELNGDTPCYVDIPTLHTHNITNIGDNELITLFWTNEFFDPERSDTYFEVV